MFQELNLTSLPAVLLFKDGTYFIYDGETCWGQPVARLDDDTCRRPLVTRWTFCVSEEQDGELKSWIKRERFPNFFLIDGYTLYAMGESGNALLLMDPSTQNPGPHLQMFCCGPLGLWTEPDCRFIPDAVTDSLGEKLKH